MKTINIAIEPELHRELKIAAAQNGVSIRDFVRDAIISKIKNAPLIQKGGDMQHASKDI